MRHPLPRRLALSAVLAAPWAGGARAQPRAPSVHFLSWTTGLATLRQQIAHFTRGTGITVRHQHVPWISYRPVLLAQLRAASGADTAWVSDAWLPELAEAGMLAPLDDMPGLTRFNAEAGPACTQAMTHAGRQYGLAYYTDSIAFFYNRAMLAAAGISTPPTSWEEVLDHGRRIQARGLASHALGLPLAADPWLIEMLSTLVFSHGGRFVDDAGASVMAEGARGIIPALTLLRDMVHRHGVLHPEAPTHNEVSVAQAFAQGRHAFALLPSYRLRFVNDPLLSDVAGLARVGLMPVGGTQHDPATCGWVRFYGMSTAAAADTQRRADAIAFMAGFGGRDAAGDYSMQKRLFLNEGLPFCTLPLLQDAELRAAMARTGGTPEWHALHQASARNKDVIAPWFGNWQAVTNEVWQAVALDRLTPDAAAALAHTTWAQLCDACRLRR